MIISRKIKATILSLPGAWVLLIPLRIFSMCNTLLRSHTVMVAKWGLSSREFTNFSYHSTAASIKRLATTLTKIEGVSSQAVMAYCAEITQNSSLQQLYRQARAKEKMLRNLTDDELRPGRQILYYCLVRALKPKVVFEAGTAHGTGSLLILHALKLNQAEGFPGHLTTVDLNPNAGKLLKHLPPDYQASMDFIVDNTEQVLRCFPSRIDLFFHDTVNISSHEKNHYELLKDRISRCGVICTSWGMSGTLADHSEACGRQYLEFTNQAEDHWACDTMGISMPLMLRAPSIRKHEPYFSKRVVAWPAKQDRQPAEVKRARI